MSNLLFQVDDIKQEIGIKIEQTRVWDEPRIKVNKTHPFWTSGNTYLKLDGKFSEECLWNPDIYYLNVHNIDLYNPSPTVRIGSPINIFVDEWGNILSWLQTSKLTLSCGMDFSYFPFDKQVKNSKLINPAR